MTSSGLEWDYYEFQPAAPGAVSVLLPTNPINAQWSSNAISDWSTSNHMTPPEIVQDPVATVKSMKEDKNKRKQRRKAR